MIEAQDANGDARPVTPTICDQCGALVAYADVHAAYHARLRDTLRNLYRPQRDH